METKEERKRMADAIRNRKFDPPSDNLKIRATVKAFKLVWKGQAAGELHFAVVSRRMSHPGALFGVYLETLAEGGAIVEKLNQLKLSFKPQLHHTWPFSVSSLEKEQGFGDEGKLSFFPSEPIEIQADRMIAQAEENYLPMLVNFVDGRSQVIDDVLNNSNFYAYPAATIAVALRLAGTSVDEAAVLRAIGTQKLRDATPARLSEIVRKLDKLQ